MSIIGFLKKINLLKPIEITDFIPSEEDYSNLDLSKQNKNWSQIAYSMEKDLKKMQTTHNIKNEYEIIDKKTKKPIIDKLSNKKIQAPDEATLIIKLLIILQSNKYDEYKKILIKSKTNNELLKNLGYEIKKNMIISYPI